MLRSSRLFVFHNTALRIEFFWTPTIPKGAGVDGAGSRTAQAEVLLDQPTASIQLKFEPEWIMPDDGGVGYFRWTMSPAEMDALLAHRDQLSNREKVAMFYNLKSLLAAGLIFTGDWMKKLQAFAADSHPAVATLAVQTLNELRALYVNDGNREQWNAYMAQLVDPVRRRFGTTAKEGEGVRVPALREAFLDLASRDSVDPELRALALRETEKFLEGSTDVDPGLVKAYLKIAARGGDQALLDKIYAAMVKASDPQRRTVLLQGLGFFGVPEVHQKALDLILDDAVTSSDVRMLVIFNTEDEARRLRTQDWIIKNFPALRKKVPLAFLNEMVTCLSAAHDQEQLDTMVDFFSQQPDPDKTLTRAVAELKETVGGTIVIRGKGQPAFDAFLQQNSTQH